MAKTCINCNLLKQASEYRRQASLYWQSWCSECIYKDSKESDMRTNDESRDKATHAWEPWTDHEIDFVLEQVALRVPRIWIAQELGRSRFAINQIVWKYG